MMVRDPIRTCAIAAMFHVELHPCPAAGRRDRNPGIFDIDINGEGVRP
jgi:hypothetical protein